MSSHPAEKRMNPFGHGVGPPPAAALGRRVHAAEARGLGDQRARREERLGALRGAEVEARRAAPRSPSAATRPGGRPPRRRRARAAAPPRAAALALERSRRRPSVASERWASQASKPPAIAPESVRQRRRPSASEPSRTRDRAEQHVGVAAQALGAREHREVGAVGERLLPERGADRVVDREQRAGGVGGSGRGGDVDDVQARVRGRLEPDEAAPSAAPAILGSSAPGASRRPAARAARGRGRGCPGSRRRRRPARRRTSAP